MSDVGGRDLSVLRHQREATRYRILVEIAERQPAVSQREVADAIGVTTQAVSDYVGDLVEEGFVRKGGRGRYRVTKEGVDWLISRTDELRAFTEHVAAEVVGEVDVEAAIAVDRIEEGQAVGLTMRDGVLHAAADEAGSSTARAVTDAEPGEAVGVTDFEGLLDYEPGAVTVLQMPPITAGPRIDSALLEEHLDGDRRVAVAGTEALALVRAAGVEPDLRFGTPVAVQEAAARGLPILLVAVAGEVSSHVDRLREQGLEYRVVELGGGRFPAGEPVRPAGCGPPHLEAFTGNRGRKRPSAGADDAGLLSGGRVGFDEWSRTSRRRFPSSSPRTSTSSPGWSTGCASPSGSAGTGCPSSPASTGTRSTTGSTGVWTAS